MPTNLLLALPNLSEARDLVVILFFASGILYLWAAVIYLLRSSSRGRAAENHRQRIEDGFVRVARAEDVLSKLDVAGAEIMTRADYKKQWDHALATLKNRQQEIHPVGRQPDNDRLLRSRVVVLLFHEPHDADLGQPELLSGLISLLEKDYYFLWVYSPLRDSKFAVRMSNVISNRTDEEESRLHQCRFLPMDERDELIPINFAVFMPFEDELTLVYTHFPGDLNRILGIRMVRADMFDRRIDTLARSFLARIPVTAEEDAVNANWNKIIAHAKLHAKYTQ